MGQPPLNTRHPDLSRPPDQEPRDDYLPRDSWGNIVELCSPPASQPAAELAAPSAPSQEGSGSARGAGSCCEKMGLWLYEQEIGVKPRWLVSWAFCPWCGAKLQEGE